MATCYHSHKRHKPFCSVSLPSERGEGRRKKPNKERSTPFLRHGTLCLFDGLKTALALFSFSFVRTSSSPPAKSRPRFRVCCSVTPSWTTKLCGRVSCGVRCVVRLVRSTSPTLTVTTKGVRCNFGLFSSRAAVVPCTSTCSAGGHVRRSCRASKICQQQQRTNTVDRKVQIQTKRCVLCVGAVVGPSGTCCARCCFFLSWGTESAGESSTP